MTVPAVTAISPRSGLPAGGAVVNITGTALTTATAVAFGAVPATAFANLSATQVVATAPVGTGSVHVTVTTAGGTSSTSLADLFEYSSGLFTVAEARAKDKAQLGSSSDYPDAVIVAKEAAIRELFTRECAVDFIPTTHTDEYHGGDNNPYLLLDWPLVTAISAAATRVDTTWTALTATELAQLQVSDSGLIYWEGGYWPAGVRNVRVTYTAGHTAVPDLIKEAALLLAVQKLPASNVPWQADGYEAGGTSYSWTRGDGFAGNWSSIPEVQRAIRMYSMSTAGIA